MGHRCRCSPWPGPAFVAVARNTYLPIFYSRVAVSLACLCQLLPSPSPQCPQCPQRTFGRQPLDRDALNAPSKPSPLAGKRVVLFSSMIAVVIINGYHGRATALPQEQLWIPTGLDSRRTLHAVCTPTSRSETTLLCYIAPPNHHPQSTTPRLSASLAIYSITRLVDYSHLPPNPSTICNNSLAVLHVSPVLTALVIGANVTRRAQRQSKTPTSAARCSQQRESSGP
jgi:hypothetical protein